MTDDQGDDADEQKLNEYHINERVKEKEREEEAERRWQKRKAERLRADQPPNPYAVVNLRPLLAHPDRVPDDLRPRPTILRRSDGRAMLYPNALNLVFGPTETGKSFLACAAGTDHLKTGGAVVYLDLDANTFPAIYGRLLAMLDRCQVPDEGQTIEYRDVQSRAEMLEAFDQVPDGALVLIDTSQQVYGRLGLSQNKGDDWLEILAVYLMPLARRTTVLIIDHTARVPGRNGPSGAHEKVDTINGSSIRVTRRKLFRPGKGGTAILSITKDRHGGLREVGADTKHAPFGEQVWARFYVNPTGQYLLDPYLDDGWRYDAEHDRWLPPDDQAAGIDGRALKAFTLMEKASRPVTRQLIQNGFKPHLSEKQARDVITELIDANRIEPVGRGRSTAYQVRADWAADDPDHREDS